MASMNVTPENMELLRKVAEIKSVDKETALNDHVFPVFKSRFNALQKYAKRLAAGEVAPPSRKAPKAKKAKKVAPKAKKAPAPKAKKAAPKKAPVPKAKKAAPEKAPTPKAETPAAAPTTP